MESRGNRRPEIHRDGARDTPFIDRMVLRFRPIAPKPAVGDSAAGAVLPESLSRPFASRKKKRKYVRVQKKSQCNGNNANTNRSIPAGEGEAESESVSAVETLHLFSQCRRSLTTDPLSVHLKTTETLPATSALPDPKVVESRVTVESVGDACGIDNHAGSLELATCPSFVTDYSFSKVLWVNEAYTRLVSGGGEFAAVVSVRLVVKEDLPPRRPAFTCQVRVEHTWQNHKYSKLLPCDVWRVDDWGGFAWRLDVKTALSLGFS